MSYFAVDERLGREPATGRPAPGSASEGSAGQASGKMDDQDTPPWLPAAARRLPTKAPTPLFAADEQLEAGAPPASAPAPAPPLAVTTPGGAPFSGSASDAMEAGAALPARTITAQIAGPQDEAIYEVLDDLAAIDAALASNSALLGVHGLFIREVQRPRRKKNG